MRCCARQPLLRHDPTSGDRLASDLNPRFLRTKPRRGSGPLLGRKRGDAPRMHRPILSPTAVSASSATMQRREGQGHERPEPRQEATRVLERRCEMQERHVAANLGFPGRVHLQRPAHRRLERKTPNPICSSRTGVQPPPLHAGKATAVRPQALVRARL